MIKFFPTSENQVIFFASSWKSYGQRKPFLLFTLNVLDGQFRERSLAGLLTTPEDRKLEYNNFNSTAVFKRILKTLVYKYIKQIIVKNSLNFDLLDLFILRRFKGFESLSLYGRAAPE